MLVSYPTLSLSHITNTANNYSLLVFNMLEDFVINIELCNRDN